MQLSARAAGLTLILLAGLAGSARADLIFLKDGYVLQGKIRREGIQEWDSGGRDFNWVPRGFFYVDGGPRRVFFSPTRVSVVEKLSAPAEERVVRRKWVFVAPQQPRAIIGVAEVGDWDFKEW